MSEKRPSIIYAYVLIGFSLVILAVSMYMLTQALNAYSAGEISNFFVYGVMAAFGAVVSISTITQMRRKMVILHTMATKVLTTVLCASCGFKIVRGFSVGDYVTKEVGQCQQCKGPMRVDVIYAEEPKTKKKT
jgi:hypothetical protein